MRRSAIAIGIGSGLLLLAGGLVPSVAHAGVPRSCVHPQAQPLECQADTRRVMLKVLPSARLQALRAQEPDLAEAGNLRSRERDRILRDIRRDVRGVRRDLGRY